MLEYNSYLTYQDYRELGGILDEDAFAKFERKAQRQLDYITFNRIKYCTTIPDEVKEVLTEMISRLDAYNTQKQNGDLVTQYSNSVEQLTYKITTEDDLKKEFVNLAIQWLPDYLTCRCVNFDIQKYLDSIPKPPKYQPVPPPEPTPPEPVYYTVTQSLQNVSTSITEETVEEGTALSGTLMAEIGYKMSDVTVTMGGTDITETAYNSENHTVNISNVTGDVVISASGILLVGTVSITSDFDSDNVSAYYEYVDSEGNTESASMNGSSVSVKSGSAVTMIFSVENTGTIKVYLNNSTGTPLFTENDVVQVSFNVPDVSNFNGTVVFNTDNTDWKKIVMVMGGDFSNMIASDFNIESI